jgi:hypothetical protein
MAPATSASDASVAAAAAFPAGLRVLLLLLRAAAHVQKGK